MTVVAPASASDILVVAAYITSLKLIIEKPLKTKFKRMSTGITNPRVIGVKQIKKQSNFPENEIVSDSSIF